MPIRCPRCNGSATREISRGFYECLTRTAINVDLADGSPVVSVCHYTFNVEPTPEEQEGSQASRSRFYSLPVLPRRAMPEYLTSLEVEMNVDDDEDDDSGLVLVADHPESVHADYFTHRLDESITCEEMYNLASEGGRFTSIPLGVDNLELWPTGIFRKDVFDNGDYPGPRITYRKRCDGSAFFLPEAWEISGDLAVHRLRSEIGRKLRERGDAQRRVTTRVGANRRTQRSPRGGTLLLVVLATVVVVFIAWASYH